MGYHSFDYTVDTKPMANSLNEVRSSVVALNGVVAAMQSAVINAEKKAAQDVCDSVDAGFYGLIASQISQKIAHVEPSVIAGQQLLMTIKRDMNKIQSNLEKDYNRSLRTYSSMFKQINKATKEHLMSLDKNAFNLIELFRKQCIQRHCDRSAFTLLMDNDVNQVRQLGAQTHVMENAKTGITCVSDYKDEYNLLEKKQDVLAGNKKIDASEILKVPALYINYDEVYGSELKSDVHLVSGIEDNCATRIKNKISMDMSSNEWSEMSDEEMNLLKQDVKSLCAKYNCSERLTNELNRLMNESAIEVCGETNEWLM